ncbi:hypothetical protein LTS17_006151 [Exophiala oligosperma]
MSRSNRSARHCATDSRTCAILRVVSTRYTSSSRSREAILLHVKVLLNYLLSQELEFTLTRRRPLVTYGASSSCRRTLGAVVSLPMGCGKTPGRDPSDERDCHQHAAGTTTFFSMLQIKKAVGRDCLPGISARLSNWVREFRPLESPWTEKAEGRDPGTLGPGHDTVENREENGGVLLVSHERHRQSLKGSHNDELNHC